MDAIAYYVLLVTPFLWWPVVLLGAWRIYKRRSANVALITVGAALLATMGTLHRLFGHSAVFDSDGKIVSETPGLLSLNAQFLWSGLGVLCVVAGLLLLLWPRAASGRDA